MASFNDDYRDLLRRFDPRYSDSQVKLQPRSYEAHVALIEALRAAGELLRVRRAREAMSAIFPLTDDMWKAWFQVPSAQGGHNTSRTPCVSCG